MPSNPNSPNSGPATPETPLAELPPIDIQEGVLKDVLEQLEKERMKRAEVESELFKITSSSATNANKKSPVVKSKKADASEDDDETPPTDIEEGVLKEVLEQLEKERIKRAEVESDLFNLKKKVEEYEQAKESSEATTDTRDVGTCTADNTSTDSAIADDEKDGEGSFTRLDEADRMNIINKFCLEFNPGYETKKSKAKKPIKRNVIVSLTATYTDVYDTVMSNAEKDNNTTKVSSSSSSSEKKGSSSKMESKTYAKDRDLHVKDEVSKFISQYQKRTPPPPFVWKYDEYIIRSLLNERLEEFISSLERLNSEERYQEVYSQVEKMRMELISLRTEKDGLLDLVNALSPNNQALQLACKKRNALPLEIVQLLEIVPWDDRAQSYASKVEFVHQWQIFDVKSKQWVDKLDLFADESASKMSNNKYHPSIELSSKETDGKIVDLSQGYALPKRGTWEWIGTWQLEGQPHLSANNSEIADKAWVYATNPVHIKSGKAEKCFNNAFEEDDEIDDNSELKTNEKKRRKNKNPTRMYRRRIWKRQRVLTSYPGISRTTHHMLNLGAQNAKLTMSVQKLHDQVFQMQNKLMEKEGEMDKATTDLTTQLSKLEFENQRNSNELKKKIKECDELKGKVSSASQTGDEVGSPILSFGSKESTTSVSSLFKFSGSIVDANIDMSKKLKGESPNNSQSNSPLRYRKLSFNGEEKSTDVNNSDDPSESKESSNTTTSDLKMSRTPLINSSEIDISVSKDESKRKISFSDELTKDSTKYKRKYTEETVSDTICEYDDNGDDDDDVGTDYVKPDSREEEEQQEQQVQQKDESVLPHRSTGFDMKVINLGSIFGNFSNTVKDVESNVHNVKHSVQAIAERTRNFQKIASQLPVK